MVNRAAKYRLCRPLPLDHKGLSQIHVHRQARVRIIEGQIGQNGHALFGHRQGTGAVSYTHLGCSAALSRRLHLLHAPADVPAGRGLAQQRGQAVVFQRAGIAVPARLDLGRVAPAGEVWLLYTSDRPYALAFVKASVSTILPSCAMKPSTRHQTYMEM